MQANKIINHCVHFDLESSVIGTLRFLCSTPPTSNGCGMCLHTTVISWYTGFSFRSSFSNRFRSLIYCICFRLLCISFRSLRIWFTTPQPRKWASFIMVASCQILWKFNWEIYWKAVTLSWTDFLPWSFLWPFILTPLLWFNFWSGWKHWVAGWTAHSGPIKCLIHITRNEEVLEFQIIISIGRNGKVCHKHSHVCCPSQSMETK